MLRLSLPPLLLLVVALAAADDARACGPDFPPSLLDDRAGAVRDLPDEPFDEAMTHLVDGLVDVDATLVGVKVVSEDVARAHGGAVERDLYARGAEAFHKGDLETAQRSWEQLLDLDVSERQHRTTWALFMLARLDRRPWKDVRDAVGKGFVDELGLAVESYGEEARRRLWADDIVGAVTLYGQQARLGGGSASTSLLFVVRELVGRDDGERDDSVAYVPHTARRAAHLAQLLRAPVGQRLLAAYASARPDEHVARMTPLLATLAHQQPVQWPDHLGAALYRRGDVETAARVVAASDTPLATWVKAKLAVRNGDVDGARALLATASRAFAVTHAPQDGEVAYWWHPMAKTPQARLLGESAVLSLSRRDYVRALDELVAADGWWQDAAFVAERVLTVDELQRWIDANTRAPAAIAAPKPADDDEDDDGTWGNWGAPPSQKAALRHLLARRLVRADRLGDAIAYFDDPALKSQALALQHALRAAAVDERADDKGDSADIVRARALLTAGEITRRFGMELRGTELAPDFFIWEGAYDTSLGWDEKTGEEFVRSDVPAGDLVDADEAARVVVSRPQPRDRFHYRFVAADLAVEAAHAVPARSQASAALLCQASRWARRDRDRVAAIWRDYVAHGAIVDFTASFGADDEECPAPDFDRLVTERQAQLAEQRWRTAAKALPLLPLVVSALLLLAVRRRERITPAP